MDFDPGAGVFELHSAGDFDIFISKLSRSGDFVWAKAMGGQSYQYGFSIALDLLGNIYTTGYFRGNCDFNPDPSETYFLNAPGNDDIFISKLDNTGNFVWAKQIVGNGDDYGLALTLNTTGELFITGSYYSPSINFDAITLTNYFSGGYTGDLFIAKLKSDLVGLDNFQQVNNFIVYPNPVNDILFLTNTDNNINEEVTITDVSGKIIKSFKLKSKTVYVGNLANGVYFINLGGGVTMKSKKFIKQ